MTTALETISFDRLIAAPFIAANQAQAEMTNNTIKFLQAFAFVKDASGNNTDEIQTFTVSSYVDNVEPSGNDADGNPIITQRTRQLTLPLLSILNLPALQIQKMSVDLTVKVTSQASISSESSSSRGFSAGFSQGAGFNFGFVNAGFSNSVSTSVQSSNSNQNSFDATTSAKYDVHVTAENKHPPGFAALLDFCNRPDLAPNRAIAQNGTPLRNFG